MEVQEFKCDKCGGVVSFDSEIQKMKCEYCGTVYDIENEDHYKEHEKTFQAEGRRWKFDDAEWKDFESENFSVYTCNSCGGEIITESTTGALKCPFCNNNVFIPEKFDRELRPDFIIPFKLDKDDAKNALREFYKGRKLLPKVFSDENHIEEIKGMYVPFWLFSGTSSADMKFRGTKIRLYSDFSYNYTETSIYDVRRKGSMDFEYVPVDASSKVDNIFMESIEPYNWNDAMKFSSDYLAGYIANRYDVKPSKCVKTAEDRIKNTTLSSFRNSVNGYSNVQLLDSKFYMGDTRINYALIPVWFLNTKWQDEYYTFIMNGQTGKIVSDDLPIDKKIAIKKFLLMMILCFAISFAIICLGYKFW